jgi:hypothetical protein
MLVTLLTMPKSNIFEQGQEPFDYAGIYIHELKPGAKTLTHLTGEFNNIPLLASVLVDVSNFHHRLISHGINRSLWGSAFRIV